MWLIGGVCFQLNKKLFSHRKCTCVIFSRHSWWNWSHLHIKVSVRIRMLHFYTTVEDMFLKINRCFCDILHYFMIFVLAFLYCLWIGMFIKFAVCFLTFFHDYHYLYLQFLQKHRVHMCLADAFVPCSALKYIWCIHHGVLPSRWQKH